MGHLVIAGTGRAGTTFLVRFLAECGLDCGNLPELAYFDDVNAGLERPLNGSGLPYVVKDPWLYSYCDEVDPAMVDVLVIPVRELHDAAASRVRVERAAWAGPGDDVAKTPGGMLSPLNVEDQARVLAVGFHRLVWWATKHNVPIKFLDYPRMVDDARYLADHLWITMVSLDGVPESAFDTAAMSEAHSRVAHQPWRP